jgi:hypothetical protein
MELPSVTRDRRALLISALIAVTAVVVLGVALLTSSGAPEPEPEPPPVATPEPEPEPEPEPPPPVEGALDLAEVVDLSVTGTGLHREGTSGDAAVPVDDAAVATFADAIRAWLDHHLTDLQDGGLGDAVAAGLAGPHGVVHLTDPQHPVVAATYVVRIGARGAPEWGEARVTVRREDASELAATLAFLPGEDGPRLVAAAGEGTAPPVTDDDVETDPAVEDERTHDEEGAP